MRCRIGTGMIALALFANALVAQERPTVVAKSLGVELDTYLTRCERFGFSGAVLVERAGEPLLRKGYGLARPEEGVPNDPETLFDIASASKQVTGAAVLLLASRDELDLDASIAELLPGVPERHAEVTVRHLLTHSGGFPRGGPTGGGDDMQGALTGYLSGTRPRAAGAKFEYFNGGYAMLAMIVERVSGRAFEDYVREELFEPAGMQRSDFIETVRVDEERIAISYDTGKPATEYIRGWGYRGMGGVLTSVSDLGLWCDALFGGDLLPEAALETLLTPHLGGYACGWYVLDTDRGTRCVQHGGTSPGFQTYIRCFPDEDLLTVVTCNREGMHWQVAWGLEALVFGGEPKVPPPPAVAAWKQKDLERLCGVYEAEGGSRLVLRRLGDALEVCAEGQRAVEALALRGTPAERGAQPAGDEAHADERARAAAIFAELLEGQIDLLSADLLPHIPGSWPARVRDDYWPAHLAEHGKLEGWEEIGAVADERSGRVRVWLRLQHAKGDAALEVAFVGTSLNIFDLDASLYPARRVYVPAESGDRLAGYAFSAYAPPEIALEGGRGPRAKRLVVDALGGEVRFER